MFGVIETIYDFISSSKNRIVIFEKNSKKLYSNKQIRQLKRVETTRWWSHDLAMCTVISTFNALFDTLDELKNNAGSDDRKSSHQAKSILGNIKSDRFLLTAFTFTQIFYIISPLSKILQEKDLDLLGATESILKSIDYLKKLRNDDGFVKITQKVKEFKKKFDLCR